MTMKIILAILLISVSLVAQQTADTTFVPANNTVTFNQANKPMVMIDEAHNNFHTISGRYQAFTKVLESDGFIVKPNRSVFTFDSLKNVIGFQVYSRPYGRGFKHLTDSHLMNLKNKRKIKVLLLESLEFYPGYLELNAKLWEFTELEVLSFAKSMFRSRIKKDKLFAFLEGINEETRKKIKYLNLDACPHLNKGSLQDKVCCLFPNALVSFEKCFQKYLQD